MNIAYSGFQEPLGRLLDRDRERRPCRPFKKPRALAADCHFLFGPGADVVQRNRPLPARINCRCGGGAVRERREMPVAWRAPRLR